MKVKVGLIVFIILGLSYTLFLVFIKDNPTIISQKEAGAIATNLYGGKVLNAKVDQGNNKYQLMLENEKGIYQLSVDSKTKKISNIELVEKKEALLTIEEAQNHIEKELSGQVNQIKQINKEGKPFVEAIVEKNSKHYSIEYDLKKKSIVSNTEINSSVKTSPYISEQKAKEIALEQINGQITNLSTVTTQNGKHYKVTVDDQAEGAHVYVQANTGKVASISWYSEQSQSKPQPKTQPQPSEFENDDDSDDDSDENDDDNIYEDDDHDD